MYILIDKKNKQCYPADELQSVADKSSKSINTLWSWVKKMDDFNWFENLDYILLKRDRIKGHRGGINDGNKHLFNRL
jgi:hypothetical protein